MGFNGTIRAVGDLEKLRDALLSNQRASTIVHGCSFLIEYGSLPLRSRHPAPKIFKMEGNPQFFDISLMSQGCTDDL